MNWEDHHVHHTGELTEERSNVKARNIVHELPLNGAMMKERMTQVAIGLVDGCQCDRPKGSINSRILLWREPLILSDQVMELPGLLGI